MRRVELHHGTATDVGRVREVNEDSALAAPPVFVVADGMGGHEGGDVASAIVVEEFAQVATGSYDVEGGTRAFADALERCRGRIAAYGEQQRAEGVTRSARAGTTVTAALLVDEPAGPEWLVANLGDSRCYAVVGDRLEQVSVDHSLVQELLDARAIAPEEVADHPERHVITRALGGPDRSEADLFRLPLSGTGRLLLCTDGVSGMLDPDALADLVTHTPDPRDAADRVVAAAVANGGEDNATAVVVDVVAVSEEADAAYDASRQRAQLQAKLGTLP